MKKRRVVTQPNPQTSGNVISWKFQPFALWNGFTNSWRSHPDDAQYVINVKQIAKFVVGLGQHVAPTDIEEGMRVGVDRTKVGLWGGM